jgi:hypothetical protein
MVEERSNECCARCQSAQCVLSSVLPGKIAWLKGIVQGAVRALERDVGDPVVWLDSAAVQNER